MFNDIEKEKNSRFVIVLKHILFTRGQMLGLAVSTKWYIKPFKNTLTIIEYVLSENSILIRGQNTSVKRKTQIEIPFF